MFNPLIKRVGSFEHIHLVTVLNLLEAINTPISLSIAIALRHGEEIKKDIKPSDYLDVRMFILDSQANALIKKGTLVKTNRNITLESIEHFMKVDKGLTFTIRDIENNFQDRGMIFECQRLIRRILGDVPLWRDLPIDKSFTTGSTSGFKLKQSTIADKVSRAIDVSPTVLPYLIESAKGNPTLNRLLMVHGFKTAPSNLRPYELEVVPKQWDKGRVIIKHHFGDVLMQRTIARFISSKLKRWGIDIENGQDYHKTVLQLFGDCFSTIDLSDASDRISPALVKLLLPLDWFHLLDRLKSNFIEYNDTTYELNKFCGQGNGFTFELETLLFFVISSVAVKRHGCDPKAVFVYGDDTIVPVHAAQAVMSAYENFGLVVNKDKSFMDGPFKESCGFDIFDGYICRPIYFKDFKPYENKTFAIIKLHNRSFTILEYLFNDIHYNSAGYRAMVYLRERFKRKLFGPPEIGDTVLYCRVERPKYKDQIAYYLNFARSYRERTKPIDCEVSQLAHMHIDGDPRGSLPRNSLYDIRICRIYGFTQSSC